MDDSSRSFKAETGRFQLLSCSRDSLSLGRLFYARSRSYLKAHMILSSLDDKEIKHPAAYMFCHAIELALKSFLFSRGSSAGTVYKIGHRTDELMHEAIKNGLSLDESAVTCILNVAKNNDASGGQLRYPTGELEFLFSSPRSYLFIDQILASAAANFERGGAEGGQST